MGNFQKGVDGLVMINRFLNDTKLGFGKKKKEIGLGRK